MRAMAILKAALPRVCQRFSLILPSSNQYISARTYMDTRRLGGDCSGGLTSYSTSNSGHHSIPITAGFSIFSATSMVTVRPTAPTLESAGTGSGVTGSEPLQFLREGAVSFSFLSKLASEKTFDKSSRVTVHVKAKHIGCLLPPLPMVPGARWKMEAPCGGGYSLRITPHSTDPTNRVCIALIQQTSEQQPTNQQQQQRYVHLILCTLGEFRTLQVLLQECLPMLYNWVPHSQLTPDGDGAVVPPA